MNARILVADDSLTIRKFVTLAFEKEAFEVVPAADGAEALERAQTLIPDVILADVFMPGLSGYELCERVKNSPQLKRTGVILMVGMFEPFDHDEAARVHSDGYLSKPMDPAELLTTIHALLRDRAAAPPPRLEGRPIEVSERARASFTGGHRIRDIIDATLVAEGGAQAVPASALDPAARRREESPATTVPEDQLASRVEDAVRRLAPAIVREVAEQVVPEMLRRSERSSG
jgi:CheY-like chemotaxis protein